MEIIVLVLTVLVFVLSYLSYSLYKMVVKKEIKNAKESNYAPVSILKENTDMLEVMYTEKPSEIFKSLFEEGDIGANGQTTTV